MHYTLSFAWKGNLPGSADLEITDLATGSVSTSKLGSSSNIKYTIELLEGETLTVALSDKFGEASCNKCIMTAGGKSYGISLKLLIGGQQRYKNKFDTTHDGVGGWGDQIKAGNVNSTSFTVTGNVSLSSEY